MIKCNDETMEIFLMNVLWDAIDIQSSETLWSLFNGPFNGSAYISPHILSSVYAFSHLVSHTNIISANALTLVWPSHMNRI